MRTITWLDGSARLTAERTGRKAMALQSLRDGGQSVPASFVVTSDAFVQFLTENGLRSKLDRLVSSVDTSDAYELKDTADQARRAIMEARFPWDMEIDVINSYKRLSHESGVVEEDVVLRPSLFLPAARDLGAEARMKATSNVKGDRSLLDTIRSIWADTLSSDMLRYLKVAGMHWSDLRCAIIVQVMVDAVASGTVTTRDPSYGDGRVVVRAIIGVGTAVKRREVNPDVIVLDPSDLTVMDRMVSDQLYQHVKGRTTPEGTPSREDVDVFAQSRPKLTDEQASAVARAAKVVENGVGEPVEVDFAADESTLFLLDYRRLRDLEIVKAPPEAAIPVQPSAALFSAPAASSSSSSSSDSGAAWDMFSMAPAAVSDDDGDDDDEPGGFGLFSDTPVKRGDSPPSVYERDDRETALSPPAFELFADILPGTRVMLALDAWKDRGRFAEYAGRGSDGVALLSIDQYWRESVRRHPLEVIRDGEVERVAGALADVIANAARSFSPRPVIVRLLSLDSAALRTLPGGASSEPAEDNPRLGLRGASRYITERNKRCARLQLKAVGMVRDIKGLKNVHIAVPCVRVPYELDSFMSLLSAEGLDRDEDVMVYPLVETWSGVSMLSELEDECDGIIIDVPSLSASLLGIDPGNSSFDDTYDYADNPSLYEALEEAVSVAAALGLDPMISGILPTDTGIIELGVEEGAHAFVAAGDDFTAMASEVSRAERRFIIDMLRDRRDDGDWEEWEE